MECVYFVCVCVCRYIFTVCMTEYLCVCKYIYMRVCVYVYIYIYSNVLSILYTSGNLPTVLSLGRQLADPHPNAYGNPV